MASSMTLRDAYHIERQDSSNPAYDIDLLHDRYGWSCSGPWLVVRTAYHGGGIVSRHRQILRALAVIKRYPCGDCTCGCVGIVLAADYESLRDANTASPYELAR